MFLSYEQLLLLLPLRLEYSLFALLYAPRRRKAKWLTDDLPDHPPISIHTLLWVRIPLYHIFSIDRQIFLDAHNMLRSHLAHHCTGASEP